MRRVVDSDYELTRGGPGGKGQKIIATFRRGEMLTLLQTSAAGAYPVMYEIAERPELEEISVGVLSGFIQGLRKDPK